MDRAQIKRELIERELIERELNKCPDFQLYSVIKSGRDRARMKHLLMQIPNFRLWHALTNSIERARRQFAVSPSSGHTPPAAHLRDIDGMIHPVP